ncbi:MAG TPA: hypothetical protein VFG22_10530 [Polyangiales bacterium]|nr:hypothetical protein [Polyangiales bacterium]
MIHDKRAFNIVTVRSAAALAKKLSEHTWTLCSGFSHGGYLFLNDSFSEDGAAEFAVVRESDALQVESITFGWCNVEESLGYIKRAVAGEFDAAGHSKIELLNHGDYRCYHCA